MKTPDDKDKTVQRPIPRSKDSKPVVPNADKTRIAQQSRAPKQDSSSETSSAQRSIKSELQKKRPVESSDQQTPVDEKTRIAPRPPLEDKTRVIPPGARGRQPISGETKKPALEDDATRISPRPNIPSPAASTDKTQFNPRRRPARPAAGSGDKTRISAMPRNDAPAPRQPAAQPRPTGGPVHTLKNRFVFEQMLGAGGMGMVYKAKDLLKIEAQDRDPYVAIKVLGEEFKSHPEAFIALQRESRKTQRIAHPNIVNVFDFDKDGDTVFMTMEFLDGKPLDKLISQYKATGLPEEDAWNVLEGISAALIYAHGENIIHSDFKPGNIFVTSKGVAKVFDFGIARAVAAAETHEDDPEDKTVFDAGNLGALTPAYASKEMLEGEEPDVRDDIYALGCIAYEMFTGRHPFDRVHANEAARLKLKPERIPGLNKQQWRALESALAFEREDRVASVEEFWDMMTRKQQSFLMTGVVTVVILVLMSSVGYLFFANQNKDPGYSEDEVRSEIELKLRVEQHQSNIIALLESLEFDKSWERNLYDEFKELQRFVGEDNQWLLSHKATAYSAYLQKIESLIEAGSLDDAVVLMGNAVHYAGDKALLSVLEEKLAEARKLAEQRAAEEEKLRKLAQQKTQQQKEEQRVEQQKRDIFDQAMKNVSAETNCRSGLNMRDLKIAISKLREVDIARYKKSEPEIVKALSSCIAKIGRSFPERATEYKKQAITLFPNNRVVSAIEITPKDPCDMSLAGLGSRGKRAICRDRMAGEARGPSMVVIPGKGSLKPFAIGKYEVSIAEYNAYCDESGDCKARPTDKPEMPITNISAAEIKNYLRWLGDKSKRKYRLPTQAEWEFAARAESGKLDSNRNCQLNSRGIQKGDTLIKTDVGAQNRWGLVNHVGNARELVTGRGGRMVAVGGSYQTAMEDCVVGLAEPHSGNPDGITGFRVLREIVER